MFPTFLVLNLSQMFEIVLFLSDGKNLTSEDQRSLEFCTLRFFILSPF